MIKGLVIGFVVFFVALDVLPQAREANIKFDGKQRRGIVADIPYPPEVVGEAIRQKMGKEGFKGSESRGWTVYKGVRLKSLGDEEVDLYVKIERKSRKEKDVSSLQMLVAKGYDNFVETGHQALQNSPQFVGEVEPLAAAMNLELEIKAQEEVLKKTQQKFDNLVTDSLDMDKKKKKLEEGLLENSKKQGQQKEEIARQQAILDQLRSRRKNN